jgi:hypothetical protein
MFSEGAARVRADSIAELQHSSGREVDGEHIGKAIDKIIKDFIRCEHRCSQGNLISSSIGTVYVTEKITVKANNRSLSSPSSKLLIYYSVLFGWSLTLRRLTPNILN